MHPQVEIENFRVIKLTGDYSIIHFGEKGCKFQLDGYSIEIVGEGLRIETLQEHLSFIRISELSTLIIKEGEKN